MKVAFILHEKEKKGISVHLIDSNKSLKEAAAKMSKLNIGALIVTDSDQADKTIGILSERDILHSCSSHSNLNEIKIKDVMHKDMIVITEEDTLETANAIMAKHHIRHLPVIKNNSIAGMITIRDISKALMDQQDIKIHYLSDFVGGTYGNKVY